MTIRGVVFDIGGVLEYTPRLNINVEWEKKLNLKAGDLQNKLIDIWKAGSIGTITEVQVHERIREILGITQAQVDAYMTDIWREYLGTPNTELMEYFRGLRPRYQTAILSNSFVGAREREQEAYQFDEMCDFIIYSHEVGMQKPNPAIYALTCERLALPPNEVIFLDDNDWAIDAANAYGMRGIVFKDNTQAMADINALLQT